MKMRDCNRQYRNTKDHKRLLRATYANKMDNLEKNGQILRKSQPLRLNKE